MDLHWSLKDVFIREWQIWVKQPMFDVPIFWRKILMSDSDV